MCAGAELSNSDLYSARDPALAGARMVAKTDLVEFADNGHDVRVGLHGILRLEENFSVCTTGHDSGRTE